MFSKKSSGKMPCLFVLIALTALLAGCSFPKIRGDFFSFGRFRSEYRETIEKDIPAENIKLMKIGGINGSVTVNFGDEKIVHVKAVKVVRAMTEKKAKDHAKDFEVIIEAKGNTLDIHTKYPKIFGGHFNGRIDFDIQAPTGLRVDAETTNGAITLGAGASGADLETTNGSVTAEGVKGGGTAVETTNGTVTVTESTGRIRVGTTNGTITVTDCPNQVDLETTNGRIKYSSHTPPKGDISLEVVNGSIAAEVPAESELDVNAKTVNGSLKVDLPLNYSTHTRKSIKGILNKATNKMHLQTVNGSISVRKAD